LEKSEHTGNDLTMRLIEIKNPQGIELLVEFIIGEPDYTREQIAFDTMRWLMESPDDTCVISLWDNENNLMGFGISFIPSGHKHLFISQAWMDPETAQTKWPELMLDHLKTFARLRGLDELRMETKRDARAFARKWGFEPFSTTMTFDLTKENKNEPD